MVTPQDVPTFALPSGFLGLERGDPSASVCIAGIPFDTATTNRSGARFGPQAIRQASRMLRDGAHPHSFADPTSLSLADIGNFRIALGDIAATMSIVESQARDISHLDCVGWGPQRDTAPVARTRRPGRPAGAGSF